MGWYSMQQYIIFRRPRGKTFTKQSTFRTKGYDRGFRLPGYTEGTVQIDENRIDE